ncbi:hypothetical protein LRAMOSA04199 [Lichtheimia ramosa]|uniref:tRNA-binding domain-containing protein n=1 Tax=Lichtheimia ramosa TaxID=688394 RepID=A0A077WYC7_9FUNG|nr:hypothetical protein LRAMOSA04199 [Lichtheimia ramosa]
MLRALRNTQAPNLLKHFSTIARDDPIHRVNLRVGKVVNVEKHPGGEHLFIEQVDLAEESPRTIVSGLAPYMAMDSLLNKKVVVVSNMKPSRFRGVLSQGMLLAATSKDNQVALLEPAADSELGERIQIADATEPEQDAPPILKPKQRVFESVAEFLKTDENGKAIYKGHPLKTNAGYVSCPTIPNGQIS